MAVVGPSGAGGYCLVLGLRNKVLQDKPQVGRATRKARRARTPPRTPSSAAAVRTKRAPPPSDVRVRPLQFNLFGASFEEAIQGSQSRIDFAREGFDKAVVYVHKVRASPGTRNMLGRVGSGRVRTGIKGAWVLCALLGWLLCVWGGCGVLGGS